MRAEVFLQGFIAFLIVAFGVPSFSPILGPIAAAAGYAIFWRAIRIYPFAKQRFWRAFLWYGAVSLIQLSWMTSIEYQGVYILLVWALLCVGVGVQFGFLSILIPYNRPLRLPRILAIASLWVLLEWSRFYFLCGYTWNLSGLAFCNTSAIQFASVFGVLGLSFWVVFSNLMGLRAFLRKGIANYAVWLGLVLVPYFFGWGHLAYHKKPMEQKEPYTCLLVQTGLLPSEKVPIQGKIRSFVSPYEQWANILTYLKEHQGKGVDLIAFPEAALPFSSGAMVYDRKAVQKMCRYAFGLAAEGSFPIEENPSDRVTNLYWAKTIANIFDAEVVLGLDHTSDVGESYNCAFHISPGLVDTERYDKRVLMPLAEYLPFRWLGPLVKYYGVTGFFTPGQKAVVFKGKVPLSASICYEETFPHKVREGRLNGAKLLVNVTNDGWYPFSRLSSQHFEHAKFRAIENGIPLVRSCNTGVSAAIDSLGKCVDRMEECGADKLPQKGVLFASVNLYEYPTLFLFWGNGGILTLCCLFLGFFLLFKKEFNW